jgi:peptidoglycan/LPS O-acetylase OafA/YrhL
LYKHGNRNWLDLARLIFSVSVVFLHVYNLVPLAGSSSALRQLSYVGGLGVPAFFAVSGFLIFMSYDKSSSKLSYFKARFYRIYPAYFLVILVMSIVAFALTFNTSNNDFFRYLFWNLIFMNFMAPEFGGLFDSNLVSAFNGALWSLKVEVIFYLSVPFMVWGINKIGPFLIPIMYFFGKTAQLLSPQIADLSGIPSETISNQFPSQIPYFISGLILYRYYDDIFKFDKLVIIACLAVYFLDIWLIKELAFTTLLIWFFVKLPNSQFKLPFGDISYGVYITHFPIIQILVLYEFDEFFGVWEFLTLVLSMVFVVSYFLSITVEKPFIKYGKKEVL